MTTEPKPASNPPSPLPRLFGRYVLLSRITRGGMGEIFLARHGLSGFEKVVAIKKILPALAAEPEFRTRFEGEAQVAVHLSHANIAQVFEVGRVDDEFFVAFEYIEGRDLRKTLTLLGDSGRGMPVDLALLIAREVANGLSYVHRRVDQEGKPLGVVHCDISPPNIMLSFEGETKIVDFGVARSAVAHDDSSAGRGFGKFGYMAPEQLIKGRTIDAGTDIYALGACLYEMLTGKRLYEAGAQADHKALARKIARGEFPVPSQHDSSLQPYDELVARALAPARADRYETAAEFRDDISGALAEVNPTISPDQLSAFMRFLFAEEVLSRRAELEQLDVTSLVESSSEISAQARAAVSFARGSDVPGGTAEASGSASSRVWLVAIAALLVAAVAIGIAVLAN